MYWITAIAFGIAISLAIPHIKKLSFGDDKSDIGLEAEKAVMRTVRSEFQILRVNNFVSIRVPQTEYRRLVSVDGKASFVSELERRVVRKLKMKALMKGRRYQKPELHVTICLGDVAARADGQHNPTPIFE